KDARWTDGRSVTAADVVYSFERATDPLLAAPQPGSSLPAALYLTDIAGVGEKLAGKAPTVSGISAPDDYTLRFTLVAPRAIFLPRLTAGPGFIVDRHTVETGGTQRWQHTAGNGPYRLRD